MPTTDSLIGTKVDVYWNLHKHVWSVRDRRTRRVIAHLDTVYLADVTFVVSAAGNARVRAEGRKNVHAFARGTVTSGPLSGGVPITYNPYKHTTFVTKNDHETPVRGAWWVEMNGRNVNGERADLPLDTESGCL